MVLQETSRFITAFSSGPTLTNQFVLRRFPSITTGNKLYRSFAVTVKFGESLSQL